MDLALFDCPHKLNKNNKATISRLIQLLSQLKNITQTKEDEQNNPENKSTYPYELCKDSYLIYR